ncbi:hypothetical protein [Vagococcus fluvialis]|uniref:hypothetical protein n=1 Tax=Vagococcus fluvialis TaxID=2738 RepID=UPI001A8E1156|nr:hypothetical protein [Vagococcus fluvialis]MBO0438083.1 hypothetical protein [Vagococcus fluvialis]
MLLGLIQTQSITLIIVTMFLWQKNGRLEKEEGRSLIAWLSYLMLGNLFFTCVFPVEMSAFNLLMIASLNGLATIAYLFIQKINFKKACYK